MLMLFSSRSSGGEPVRTLAGPVYNSAVVAADYKAQVPAPDSLALVQAYKPGQMAVNTTAARAYKQPDYRAAAQVPVLDTTAVQAQNC